MGVPLVHSRVSRVIVFRRGALVERTAELAELGAASHLRIGPLPLGADDDSIEVHAEDCTPTECRVVLATMEHDARLRPPDDEELEAARAEVLRLEARAVAVRQALGSLAAIPLIGRRYAPDGGPEAIPTDARRTLVAMRRREAEGLDAQLAEVMAALRDAARHRDTLVERQRRATSARQTRAHELRKAVDVSFRDAPRGRVRVRYRVGAARWCPTYTLRFDSDLRGGSLEMRAMVAQRSGEDWTGATMTLSSAKPHRHVDLPEPQSIRIGRKQAPPRKAGWREPPAGASALFADFDRGYPKPPTSETRKGAKAKPVPARPVPPPAMAPPGMPPPGPPPGPVPQGLATFGMAAEVGAAMPPGAMPSPAPASAPMPMQAAGAAPPAPRRRSSRGEMKKKSKRDAAPLDDLALEAPAEAPDAGVRAADELLAYGRLRMGGPGETDRGQLRRATAVERYREVLEADGHAISFDVAKLLSGAARAAVKPFPPRTQEPVAVDGFDHAFDVSSPVDVPADGQFHGVPVQEAAIEAKPYFVCVPREADDVFRFVETRNPLGAPLLPAPLDVYVGGKYLLGRSVSTRPAGATWALGLGVEQRIKVARNTRFEERSAGLMGRALELVHAIDIEVENHTGAEARVEIRERVPVVREGEDDIEVSHESNVTWRPLEPESKRLRGGLVTTLVLAASAKKKITSTYVVRISAKHQLVGGNRRE